MSEPLLDCPYAFGGPVGSAVFKQTPEDFQVREVLGFQPSGSGPFVWLQVEKRAANTRWVAGQLADRAGIKAQEVGYAGLKDRQAQVVQWFSLPLNNARKQDWLGQAGDGWCVIQQAQHKEKLRPGDHQGNHFLIRLRDFEGQSEQCQETVRRIQEQGFPNYFGAQRFGRQQSNLTNAQAWFRGETRPPRKDQGLLLSAVRAYLFNQVLAQRLRQGFWRYPLPGDLLENRQTGQCFPVPKVTPELTERCRSGELVPTGPLQGSGEPKPGGEALELERRVLAGQEVWTRGLERQRMRPDRRALCCRASELNWHWQGKHLLLEFGLPGGAFATMLLREICSFRNP